MDMKTINAPVSFTWKFRKKGDITKCYLWKLSAKHLIFLLGTLIRYRRVFFKLNRIGS